MTEINKTFLGKNIKRIRKSKNMSQSDLGKLCFLSTPAISSYENGHTLPSLNTIASIAQAFGVSIDTLCFGDEESAIVQRPVNRGRKIANCFQYLFNEGYLFKYKDYSNHDTIVIHKDIDVFLNLYANLHDFRFKHDNYPNPEVYVDMMLEGVGNELNKRLASDTNAKQKNKKRGNSTK